MKSYSFFSLC
uniref:Uncharacterized protein n=1 Tax=Anguilla anguilla TaxID=7936 RepID=A0A0E9QB87_ANGAN